VLSGGLNAGRIAAARRGDKMTEKRDDQTPDAGFFSPPCAMHEVDPAYMGLENPGDVAGQLADGLPAGLAQALLSGLPDAIVYSDSTGLIRFWNSGEQRI